ncbi:hypothetical protein [Achromobacter denitrificans]|uniref:hypothetical protein n=1 Tax=Achromobacter denitrificans TaxID=32002 RepID=UPI0015959174|nr:hypothetical protein [Achromobacter denitrificans]
MKANQSPPDHRPANLMLKDIDAALRRAAIKAQERRNQIGQEQARAKPSNAHSPASEKR